MKLEISPHLEILQQACHKYGYKWEMIDKFSNNLVKISYKNKFFYTNIGKIGAYPLNSQFAAQIAKDKAWAYKIMKRAGFKVPRGDYFFLRERFQELRGEGREVKDAFKYARKLGYPVFVKPNSRSLGVLAEVIYSPGELKQHLTEMAESCVVANIQAVIKAPEYRIFVIDGQVQYAYRRMPPKLVGNGRKSIKRLLNGLNAEIENDFTKINPNNGFFLKQLVEKKYNFQTVLGTGEELLVSSTANLSGGGTIEDYRERVPRAAARWVKKLTQVFNLRVCGIDVFVKKSLQEPHDFIVIEVNRSPNLLGIYKAGYQAKTMEIWGKIMKKYFKGE